MSVAQSTGSNPKITSRFLPECPWLHFFAPDLHLKMYINSIYQISKIYCEEYFEFDVLVFHKNHTIQTKCQKYSLISSVMELSLKDSQYVARLVFI